MKRNYSKKVAISLLASLLLLGQNIEANTLETISAQTHQIITYGDEEERERKVNPYAFEIILPDYIYVGQVIPIDFIFADYPRTSKEDIMDIRVAPVEPPGPAINPVNRPLHLHNQSYVIKVDVPIYPYNIYETHYYLMAELPLIGLPIEIGYIMIEATTRHFVTARRIQVRPIYYLEVYESHVYMSDSHDMHQFRVIPRNYHGMDISEWLPHLSSMPLFRLRWSLNHLLPNTPANISQSGLVTLTRPFLWNHLDRFRVIAEYDPIAQGPILNGLFMHGPRSLHAIGVQESDFSLIHENHVRNMSIYGVEFNIIDGIPHGTHFGNALLSQIINGIRFGGLGAGGTVSFNVTYA
ncbi:MAG: hypothetical protein FWF50_00930, partial [Defluviitaleaceae bacterium]|nr:hypothetical protein [Defluviitaleaceae bacterium]